MRVSKNSVVTLSYIVSDSSGEIIDVCPPEEPFELWCGSGQLVNGFERALMGMRPGEHKEFVLQPEEAYGEHDATLVKTLPRSSFPSPLDVGMRIPMRSPEGVELVCRIVDIRQDMVVADFNHPLAGEPLRCSVDILDVRAQN